MTAFRLRLMTRVLPFLLVLPATGYGQQFQAPTPGEAAAAINPAAPLFYTRAQLDQMLAPIALYPDQLLMQVLMAATFPREIVDARQWLDDPNNAALRSGQLAAALEPLPWDPSVKSLVAFPQIIGMMNEHFDWTQALGVAFANQQVATMARVQYLRNRAAAAGRLRSSRYLRIVHQGPEIIIEPANPNIIYVPVYNPAEVYGSWQDEDYPPVYMPPPPEFVDPGFALGVGLGFSVGFGVVHPLWGWGHPDWRRREMVVDPGRYRRITNAPSERRNNIAIRNNTWHRTAPVTPVVAPPPRPARTTAGPATRPPGTAAPAVVRPPLRPTPPGPTPGPHPGPIPELVRPTPPGPTPGPHPGPTPGPIRPTPPGPTGGPHPGPTPGLVRPMPPGPIGGPHPGPTPGLVRPMPPVPHPVPQPPRPTPPVVRPAPPVPHPAPQPPRPTPPVVHPAPPVPHPAPPPPHPVPPAPRPAPPTAHPAPPAPHPAPHPPAKPGENEQQR